MARIVVTGAAGFIGSCMINKLNNKGFGDIIAVDEFSRKEKMSNLQGKSVTDLVHRNDFFHWFESNHGSVEAIYHLGARTDTTETDQQIFDALNLNYSKQMFLACAAHRIPLIYASSAATYGSGELGYLDDHNLISRLQPLNAYGVSKNDFDVWVLAQDDVPPFWAGMKFFNVYGPNEYHKGRMASVVFHAYRQIRESGTATLFRSHRTGYADGEQLRDFIYVKDVVSVLLHLMVTQPEPGLYNLGSGEARSFNELVRATFKAVQLEVDIRYIDTPSDIREKYQYYTCASIEKLRDAGYRAPFFSLEEGISDYVQTYLESASYY